MGSTPKRAFHLFPRLPADIRYEIWQIVASVPRDTCIGFSLRPAHTVPESSELCSKLFRVYTKTRVPSMLHVSREARDVGLQNYHKCFRKFGAGTDSEDECFIYFNVKIDRIYMMLPAVPPELLHGAVRLLVSSASIFRAPPKCFSSAPPAVLPIIGLYSVAAPRRDTYLIIQSLGGTKSLEEARLELSQLARKWRCFEMQIMADWETAWGVILVTHLRQWIFGHL